MPNSHAHGNVGQVTSNIRRVVDTNTQIPGQTFDFNAFGSFVMSGDDVVFTGSRTEIGQPDFAGLFRYRNGSIDVLVDTNTDAPGENPESIPIGQAAWQKSSIRQT